MVSRAHDRVFECPISWCRGGWDEHSEGAPDRWLHASEVYQVTPGIRVSWHREGAGPLTWELAGGDVSAAAEFSTAAELAAAVRKTADAVEFLALAVAH